MSNFDLLLEARNNGASVAFTYLAKDGEVRQRVGTVDKLTDSYVTLYDTDKQGFRTCNLSGIVSPIAVDKPLWSYLPDDVTAVNYWYHELKERR